VKFGVIFIEFVRNELNWFNHALQSAWSLVAYFFGIFLFLTYTFWYEWYYFFKKTIYWYFFLKEQFIDILKRGQGVFFLFFTNIGVIFWQHNIFFWQRQNDKFIVNSHT
jgi:hypothetical protein